MLNPQNNNNDDNNDVKNNNITHIYILREMMHS